MRRVYSSSKEGWVGWFVYSYCMRKVTFDIETKNFFTDTGSNDPASLDLACVCIHDSETGLFTNFFEEDLKKLWPILEKTDLLIGFNSDHFDIPLLNKYYQGDLTKIKSVDLMKEIKKKLGRRIKLDTVAEATLGRNKTAEGAMANVWGAKGEKQKVVDYCIDDVGITKDIYDYALKNSSIKYKDGKALRELKLDTGEWESQSHQVLTHTLPF